MVRTLIIAIVATALLWWLSLPRPKRRHQRAATSANAYAPVHKHLRTFRTPGGIATSVYEVRGYAGRDRSGRDRWHTSYAWYCDCNWTGGDDYEHHVRTEAIKHHETHVRGAA